MLIGFGVIPAIIVLMLAIATGVMDDNNPYDYLVEETFIFIALAHWLY